MCKWITCLGLLRWNCQESNVRPFDCASTTIVIVPQYRILISKMTHDACIQKELGDRKSASIDFVRQLLPLPKMYCEVIMSEYVHSGSSDTRGSGSMHKANNEADQRKQVSTKSSVVVAWLTIT